MHFAAQAHTGVHGGLGGVDAAHELQCSGERGTTGGLVQWRIEHDAADERSPVGDQHGRRGEQLQAHDARAVGHDDAALAGQRAKATQFIGCSGDAIIIAQTCFRCGERAAAVVGLESAELVVHCGPHGALVAGARPVGHEVVGLGDVLGPAHSASGKRLRVTEVAATTPAALLHARHGDRQAAVGADQHAHVQHPGLQTAFHHLAVHQQGRTVAVVGGLDGGHLGVGALADLHAGVGAGGDVEARSVQVDGDEADAASGDGCTDGSVFECGEGCE